MREVVLVTGGSGNVGSAVVTALIRGGASVRVAELRPDRGGHPDGVDAVRFDFTEPNTFEYAVRGATRMFLIRPPAISRVGPTLNRLIDVAAESGMRHIVFSSVAGADTNRIVPHHRVEAHLEASGLEWTMLRPGFFSQNIGSAYRPDITERDRIHVPAGDGRVAFVDTRDIGDVAALTLTTDGHAGMGYHLTGPEAVTFEDLAVILSAELGRTIEYEPASILGYFAHLRRQGLVVPQALVQTILHAGLRRGDAEPVTSVVSDVLGRPARSVADYVSDHRELWVNR